MLIPLEIFVDIDCLKVLGAKHFQVRTIIHETLVQMDKKKRDFAFYLRCETI
jgi:hypothetical protein